MSYVAFFDLLGTRVAAQISNSEYKSAIEDFNRALRQISSYYNCKIYGYSDNAYAEISKLDDMISFFSTLRKTLMGSHRYFSAYVSKGSLKCQKEDFSYEQEGKTFSSGFSMKFTDSKTTEIYINQSNFKGIGISLSDEIVQDIQKKWKNKQICQSVFLPNPNDDSYDAYTSFYDIAYDGVLLEELKYVLSDYVMATVISKGAGRHYVSPIVSMIKSLGEDILNNQLNELIELLIFKNIPELFSLPNSHKSFALVFIATLIDRILSIKDNNCVIDIYEKCKYVIYSSGVSKQTFLEKIPELPYAIITNENKRKLVSILYNVF